MLKHDIAKFYSYVVVLNESMNEFEKDTLHKVVDL
jgi:hypothetical protein